MGKELDNEQFFLFVCLFFMENLGVKTKLQT